ncbi:hypothetical protein ACV229_21610 [Burkholderia sp. MR1-5-21]
MIDEALGFVGSGAFRALNPFDIFAINALDSLPDPRHDRSSIANGQDS